MIGLNSFDSFKKISLEKIGLYCEGKTDFYDAALKQENLYISPSNYLDWNSHLKFCLAAGSASVSSRGYMNGDGLTVKVGQVAREAVLANAPARYLSKELCEAFAMTAIPVLPSDVIEILPYMHLMIPRRLVYDHQGDEILSIIIKTGVIYPKTSEEEDEINRSMCEKLFPNESLAPKNLYGAKGIEIATLTRGGSNLWQEFIDENTRSWHDENVKYKEKSGYSREETEKIIRIAINSLLVHLHEPELITTDSKSITKGVGFGSTAAKGALGLTWIGKSFRYQRLRERALPGQEGTTGSVRAHWRRGHWHTILFGKNKQERRVQWFKPVFVTGGAPK